MCVCVCVCHVCVCVVSVCVSECVYYVCVCVCVCHLTITEYSIAYFHFRLLVFQSALPSLHPTRVACLLVHNVFTSATPSSTLFCYSAHTLIQSHECVVGTVWPVSFPALNYVVKDEMHTAMCA